jgi:glycosyltransferase involved in cell wall biosynthesis
MDTPVISVIITTYNHEKYIAQAIESVLAQKNCPSYEIIIGEDCSTDGTRLIIENYAKKDNRLRIVEHNANVGMQRNLKACIDVCRGQYIAVCEGDDYWIDEYKLKKQYEALEKNPSAVMCFSDINLLFENGTTTKHFENKQEILPEVITSKEIILFNGPSATFSCCMYKALAAASVPQTFFERKDTFDLLFNLYTLEHGTGIFLKEVCVNYRITSGGIWSKKSDKEKRNETARSMCVYNQEFDYKYDDYFRNITIRTLGGNIGDTVKREQFREIFAVKIPCPGKRILKISIQGGRRNE